MKDFNGTESNIFVRKLPSLTDS